MIVFIYSTEPLVLPVPATAIVVAGLLAVVPWIRGSAVLLSRNWLAGISLAFLFASWSAATAFGFGTYDFTFASICVKYGLSVFGATALWLLWASAHRSWRDSYHAWLTLLIIVGTVQGVVVLAEVLVPGVKEFLNATIAFSGNVDYTEGFNVRGLGRAGGAGGSLVQALVVATSLGIYATSGRPMVLFAACIAAASCMFLGRTGFIFAIGLFLLFAFWRPRRGGWALAILAGFVALAGLGFAAVAGERLEELWNWVVFFSLEPFENFLAGEGFRAASTEELGGMYHLPGQLRHLLLGAGFFERAHWGYGLSDVGYLKTIYAVGLPMALVVYVAFLFAGANALVSARHRYPAMVPSLLVVMAMFTVAEFKEPFLYQNAAGRLLLLLVVPLLLPVPSWMRDQRVR